MNRQFVVSSNLRSVGYDPKEQKLEIEFVNGSVYVYSRVPEQVFHQLMQAPSKGRYHHAAIRDRYGYRRIW